MLRARLPLRVVGTCDLPPRPVLAERSRSQCAGCGGFRSMMSNSFDVSKKSNLLLCIWEAESFRATPPDPFVLVGRGKLWACSPSAVLRVPVCETARQAELQCDLCVTPSCDTDETFRYSIAAVAVVMAPERALDGGDSGTRRSGERKWCRGETVPPTV